MSSERCYVFGYFSLWPERRALSAGEQPIKLGARAFDLLVALVESAGRMLTKGELLEIVWPKLVVEENNLNVQIVAVRKALGHAAIATIPGRGYRFVMPVELRGAPAPAMPPTVSQPPSASTAAASAPRTNLPSAMAALYGRADDVGALVALLANHPVVTVAGAGGIGKTRLGQAVAYRVLSGFPDGVWWVELAALSDAGFVAATVAQALRMPLDGTRPAASVVVAALRSQRALLVLDNCEHLLDAVAAFVDSVRASAPDVRVLVTSQEALKSVDEHIYRLGTLSLPLPSAGSATANARALAESGAGALFVARARAVDPRFELNAANVDAVLEICRRLDGIPLAIELAAARLPLLGVEGVRTRLKERFNILTGGTRAVLRRHQTLRAALEWSHGLLSAVEQAVFRRLGVFAGGFTLESAQRVAEDDEIDMWDVLEHLGTLVDKSLVLAEGATLPRYRMLETTRLFALEQLGEAGETEAMLRRHAEAMVALLEPYAPDTRRRNLSGDAGALVACEADNVRAALDWLDSAAQRADDVLAARLGGVAAYALVSASGVSEAFDRTVVLSGRVDASTPPAIAARYWLALATWGAIGSRIEGYEAAGRAAELYRELGDDERLYSALTQRIAIGARRGEPGALAADVAEATRIERVDWPSNRRTAFCWACYRWLQAEGRAEEALVFAQRRAAIHRDAGALAMEQINLGDVVADCELALGRADDAEAHARTALAALQGEPAFQWGMAHVLETLAIVCTMQERHDEAIGNARAALLASRDVGLHFRLLEPMALSAALQGRLDDAAWAAGHVDALYAERGEVRWPAVRARRARLDALLAEGLGAEPLRRLREGGAIADLEAAFARVFGRPATGAGDAR